jgi:hypothetical protein
LPLAAYMGAYHDPAYGTFTVRPIPSEAGKHPPIAGDEAFYERITGEDCEVNRPVLSTTSLLVDMGPRLFNFSHFVLTYSGGHTWKATRADLFQVAGKPGERRTVYSGSPVDFEFRGSAGKVEELACFGVGGWKSPAAVSFDGPAVVFQKQGV